jgi:hypothetical protein
VFLLPGGRKLVGVWKENQICWSVEVPRAQRPG